MLCFECHCLGTQQLEEAEALLELILIDSVLFFLCKRSVWGYFFVNVRFLAFVKSAIEEKAFVDTDTGKGNYY